MKAFKKYYIITASPEQVYRALTTETTVRLWTGDEAKINAVEEGEFSLWDGAITGRFLSLFPFSEIIQEWYFGEQEEQSIVTLRFHANHRGTSLEVRHTNIPDEAYDDIVSGWDEVYAKSLVDFYEGEE